MPSTFHSLGIRHHGPGSARAVCAALDELKPDYLLIEGPPECNELVQWVADKKLIPPIALLVYDPNKPQDSGFWPFAEFSPEWQALLYAQKHNIPVKFMDANHGLLLAYEREQAKQRAELAAQNAAENTEENTDENTEKNIENISESQKQKKHHDPIRLIAEAAGYADAESWWDVFIEQRNAGGIAQFEAVQTLMREVRGALVDADNPLEQDEILREASMRQILRAAAKTGAQTIAIVCGAWHVPALLDENGKIPSTAAADGALVKSHGLVRCDATWVPWHYPRLAQASGYGAGIESPAYYELLWQTPPEQLSVQWMTRAARVLRKNGLDVPSASIIESARLADTLASVRERGSVGLTEFLDSSAATFLNGQTSPLDLLHKKMVVGDKFGEIPSNLPRIPIQIDLQKNTKRLRLPLQMLGESMNDTETYAVRKTFELDLRKENDLERSRLLHRLQLLDIKWGEITHQTTKGTFKETWHLAWSPEMTLKLIEASRYGTTVRMAAAQSVLQQRTELSLPNLAEQIRSVLVFAHLPELVLPLLKTFDESAVTHQDVGELMASLVPLVELLRYSDVRSTDAAQVAPIVSRVAWRVFLGLPNACSALDEDASKARQNQIEGFNQTLQKLEDAALLGEWKQIIQKISDLPDLNAGIAGFLARLCFDYEIDTIETLSTKMGLALSSINPPTDSIQWLSGFLRGSHTVLVFHENLLNILNNWLLTLDADVFVAQLPLLRRSFTMFSRVERREIGDAVQKLGDLTQPHPHNIENLTAANDALFANPQTAGILQALRGIYGV